MLKQQIEIRNMHIQKAGEIAGISETAMCSKINGRSEFKLPEAMRLAAYFGIPVEKLFCEAKIQ